MKNTVIHLATGFEEVEALSVVDVLRRAGINITIVSMTGEKAVRSSHDVVVEADELFEDVDYANVDMIILPGGKEGTENLFNHNGLKSQIQHFYESGKYLAAICAGPSVYGRMGLLKGEQAIAFPAFQEYLEGAELVDVPAVKSNNFITGKGVGVALHFGLKIVETLLNRETALELSKKMVMTDYE